MEGIFSNLKPLERMLDYHLERQNVIHANIANVDTPGYQAIDLGFIAGDAHTFSGQLNTTQSKHIALSAQDDAGIRFESFEDGAATTGNDLNSVSLENEMGKLAANNVRYEAVAEVLSRRLAMLRYAAADGQG